MMFSSGLNDFKNLKDKDGDTYIALAYHARSWIRTNTGYYQYMQDCE